MHASYQLCLCNVMLNSVPARLFPQPVKPCPSRSVLHWDVLRTLLSAFGAGGVAEGIALGVDFAAEVFEDVVGHLEENLDDIGIKLAAGPCLDFLSGLG